MQGLRLPTPHYHRSRPARGAFVCLILAMAIPASLWSSAQKAPTTQTDEAAQWGKTVVGIQLQTDSDLRIGRFAGRIVQATGQPLDEDKVSESIKNLYATGRFDELDATAKPAPGGVELIFKGKARYFVGIVSVRGTPSSLDAEALANATRLRLGHSLSEENLPAAADRVKQSLQEDGYYQASVAVETERDPKTQEVNVTFVVQPGRPANLRKVILKGHPAFPLARVMKVAHWRLKHHLTSARVEQGLFRLHNFYSKKGYLQANAMVAGRTYDQKSNSEDLTVEIDSGPVIQIQVKGAKISKSSLRNLLPIYTDGIVDQPSLERGSRAIQDYFQKKGFVYASVKTEPVAKPDANHIVISYDVQLGQKGDFDGYTIRGNHEISSEAIESVLTQRTGGVLFEHAIYSKEMLDANVQAIEQLYESRGFLSASVTPEFSANLRVTLNIKEGPRTRVRHLALDGVSPELKNNLAGRLLNIPGAPFSQQNMAKDRVVILSFFSNRGYAKVQLKSAFQPVAGEHAMDVTYTVYPGNKETVRQVLLLGNKYTRPSTIRRELTIAPGQASNESGLLDSQNRLYDLGVFNKVQIAPQDPNGDETSKTMLVNVEEARRWTLGYGGGIEVQRLGSNQPQGQFKASPSAILDVTRLNVGGRAQTASLRARFSTLDRGASLSYFVPHFTSHRSLSARFSALFDRSSDVQTFTAERAEVSVDVEKRYSRHTLLAVHYSFRNVRAFNVKISPQEIPLFNRSARIGMLGMSYINDHRDNPADPTRGSYSLADLGVASTALGSQANFIRFSGQNSTYYHLGKRIIFARDTRIGIESPFGGLQTVHTTVNGVPEVILTHAIPLPERFFMGGSESHRGFSVNQAGPRDPVQGYPIGGNALFLNTFELRIPFAENRLGVVLFHDMGNVYTSVRRMKLFKVSQNSPTDFDYTVHAVGIGFRYKTPVGPLRVDFGYALNPTEFQVQSQVNGKTVTGVQQLSRFQYFIGIGQTF